MSIIIYHPDGIDDVELCEALQAFYKQQSLIIGWDCFRPVPLNSLVCAALLPDYSNVYIAQEQGYVERIIHLDEAMKEFNLSQPAFRYYENRLRRWVAEQRAPFSVDDALSALLGMDIRTDTAQFAIPSIRNALTNLGCTTTVTVVYTPPQHGTANKIPPSPPPARPVTGDIYS